MLEPFFKKIMSFIMVSYCSIKGSLVHALRHFMKAALLLVVVIMVKIYLFLHKHYEEIIVGTISAVFAAWLVGKLF